MPTVHKIDSIKIMVYFDDHLPPHFHAEYNEYEELFVIRTLQHCEGDCPPDSIKRSLNGHLTVRNGTQINVYFWLVLFPLYFIKSSLNTGSIRVRFDSSKEKITARKSTFIYVPFLKIISCRNGISLIQIVNYERTKKHTKGIKNQRSR